MARSPRAYAVLDLGTLGGKHSTASAINNKGEVAGTAHTVDAGRAFLWRDGKMHDLGALRIGSQAFGINDRGDVVGVSGGRAFLWRDGKMRALDPAAPHQANSDAGAINDRGQIAGRRVPIAGKGARAFLWQNGAMRDLGTLPDGFYSVGLSINEKGEIVGYGHGGKYFGAFGIPRAFLWDSKNGMREIGTLGGGRHYDDSFAYAINDRGQIVGVSNRLAFLWKDGKMRSLGTLPGYRWSRANAINNQGEVVGVASKRGDAAAFLWSANRMADLNDLVPRDSGWRLESAYGINDAGQIAGHGNRNGVWRALLLTPARHRSGGREKG